MGGRWGCLQEAVDAGLTRHDEVWSKIRVEMINLDSKPTVLLFFFFLGAVYKPQAQARDSYMRSGSLNGGGKQWYVLEVVR